MDKEKEVFKASDEYCGECGCGVDCDDPLHHASEDLDFHDVNEDAIMHLVLDDDTELECMVLGFFRVDESEYIALLPIDEKEADAGVLLYEYVELEDEAFDLLSIEDDNEFEAVSEAFAELFTEEELTELVSEDEEDDFIEYENYDDLNDKVDK